MPLTVEDEWSGRFDDQLAALPGGRFASAASRALTLWTNDGPGAPVVISEAQPGPLLWLPGSGQLAWGAGVVDAQGRLSVAPHRGVLADLGEAASQRYTVTMGTVDRVATTAIVALKRQASKVVARHNIPAGGPQTRLALLGLGANQGVVQLGDDLGEPTALVWVHHDPFVAFAGRLDRIDPGTGQRATVPTASSTSVRCLTQGADGKLIAGFADGTVVLWPHPAATPARWLAHHGPVLAAGFSPDGAEGLATGGADGTVVVWSRDSQTVASVTLGSGVEALAWFASDRLVAKAGGPGGRVVTLRLS